MGYIPKHTVHVNLDLTNVISGIVCRYVYVHIIYKNFTRSAPRNRNLNKCFSKIVRPHPGKFFFLRRGPGPNKFIRKYLYNFFLVHTLTLRQLMLFIYMEHLFLMFLDHTQRRSTVGRTPLDEWSVRRRDFYLTTHDNHNRRISMPPGGFEPTITAGERPQATHLLRS